MKRLTLAPGLSETLVAVSPRRQDDGTPVHLRDAPLRCWRGRAARDAHRSGSSRVGLTMAIGVAHRTAGDNAHLRIRPPPPGFDGLLMVRTYYWFDFEGPFNTGPASAPDDARYQVLIDFYNKFFTRYLVPTPSFYIAIDPGAFWFAPPWRPLDRIAIMFHPQLHFGPRPETNENTAAKTIDAIKAQVIVHVVDDAYGEVENTLLRDTPPSPIRLNTSAVDLSLERYAIGISPRGPIAGAPPGTPAFKAITDIVEADLQPLADKVASLLGDPGDLTAMLGAPTRTVRRITP